MRLPLLLAAAALLAAQGGHAWRMPVVGSGCLKGGSTSLVAGGGRAAAAGRALVDHRGARGGKPMTMPIGAAASTAAGRDGGVGFLDPREAARPSLQAAEAHFLQHLNACPFIAVLRGVQAPDVVPTIQALAAEGFTLASVPAEAPAGLAALRGREVQQLSSRELMLGAATVTSVEQVDSAAEAGASFISCPHVDPEIIERATARGLVVLPGVLTPTEAFLAVKHGARILKLFPSQAIPPGMVKSVRAVLPPHVQLLVSGGVQPEDMPAYLRAGALGFALGSTLYSPGLDTDELRRRARLFRDAVERGRETDAWAAATLGL